MSPSVSLTVTADPSDDVDGGLEVEIGGIWGTDKWPVGMRTSKNIRGNAQTRQ